MKTTTDNIPGKPWYRMDLQRLKKLAQKDTPTHIISRQLDRDIRDVRNKAAQLRLRLFN